MQTQQIRQLRHRKHDIYRALLPSVTFPMATSDLGNDSDYAALLMNVAQSAPRGFGLTVGLHRRLSDLGVLGHVTMSCATLGEVFDLWMIYADGAGELVTFEAASSGDGEDSLWSILIKPFAWLSRDVATLLVEELCATFFVLAQEITDRRFAEFSIELPHAPVAGIDYAAAFPGAVSFGAKVARVTGPASALTLPVRLLNSDPLALLIDQLGVDRAELQGMKPTTLQVFDVLIRRRGPPPTLRAVAAALHTSPRTLVRHLAAEGTSFGAILDEFRRRYAMALAQYGGMKAKQIAYLVGFRSENSLRKAFRKWTGRPIGRWSSSLP